MIKLTLATTYLLFCTGKLVFKIGSIADIAQSEDWDEKNKKTVYFMGEDGACTGPLTLAAADGLGGSPFISYYFANFLAFKAARLLSNVSLLDIYKPNTSSKTFKSDLVDHLNEEVKNYSTLINTIVTAYSMKKHVLVASHERNMAKRSATTLISCFINNAEPGNENLVVYQRGDSGITKFVLQSSFLGAKTFAYIPSFFIDENQREFNAPFAFSPFNMNTGESADVLLSLNLFVRDLVIVGTDGLFDNVHLSLMTKAVNHLVKLFASGHATPARITEDMGELANKYYLRLVDTEEEPNPTEEVRIEKKPSFFRRVIATICCFSDTVVESEANNAQIHPEPSPSDREIIPPKKEERPKAMIKEPEIVEEIIPEAQKEHKEKSFFDCDYKDFVWEPEKFLNAPRVISGCIEAAILNEYKFDEEALKNFEANFDAKLFAEGLRFLAHRLSGKANYASTFYLHSLAPDVKTGPYAKTGKPDDITVIAGLVQLQDETNAFDAEKQEIWRQQIDDRRAELVKELEADVESFLDNYNDDSFEPKLREKINMPKPTELSQIKLI